MIFCYIRRVESCTVVISEASSGRRWEQVQSSIVRHYPERKPKLEVFIGSLPVETGPVEEGEERVQVSEGMENIIITWHSESTKQALHGLTETEAAIIRHAWARTRFPACVLGLLAWCLCASLSISNLFLLWGFFSSYWIVLLSLDMRAFTLSYYILFGFHLLEACSFWRGKFSQDILYVRRIYFPLK